MAGQGQVIKTLRELFNKAPFLEFQKARQKLLQASGHEDLSSWYEARVRQAANSSVYTPRELAQELFSRMPRVSGRYLDACAGTGRLARPFLKAGLDVTLLDEDDLALDIAAMELGAKTYQADFLTWQGTYDVILSNPPYEGHKTMSLETRTRLKADFPEVMKGKADLSYAFFVQAHRLLKPGGLAGFIVSRYWLEAQWAEPLREFILSHFTILYLHDYYGSRPFGAGIDPLIIILKKQVPPRDHQVTVKRGQETFDFPQAAWSSQDMKPLTRRERQLKAVMAKLCPTSLGEEGSFHQGIITGLDKAFVMTRQEALAHGIEEELLVPWIKSKDLRSGGGEKVLIYAQREAKAYAGFMNYIERYRADLSRRREVMKGSRAFYELQWGRQKEVFEEAQILFAFKAAKNDFRPAAGRFHSADIYGYRSKLPTQWLLTLLNSQLYETYTQLFLKKLGADLYEYYPHRLGQVRLPDPQAYPDPNDFISCVTAAMHQGNPLEEAE